MDTGNTPTYPRRDYDHLLKLLIIGDSSVGKSNMMLRFADNLFTPNYITTIGVDFKIRTITVDGERVKLQIWDTAGQERFRTITSTYYRGTHGVVVVYDITRRETFDHLMTWLQEINQNCDHVQRIIVGNKCDERDRRAVSFNEAKRYADQTNVQYFETSAKENVNIDEMFTALTKQVLNAKRALNQTVNSGGIKVNERKRNTGGRKKDRRCC